MFTPPYWLKDEPKTDLAQASGVNTNQSSFSQHHHHTNASTIHSHAHAQQPQPQPHPHQQSQQHSYHVQQQQQQQQQQAFHLPHHQQPPPPHNHGVAHGLNHPSAIAYHSHHSHYQQPLSPQTSRSHTPSSHYAHLQHPDSASEPSSAVEDSDDESAPSSPIPIGPTLAELIQANQAFGADGNFSLKPQSASDFPPNLIKSLVPFPAPFSAVQKTNARGTVSFSSSAQPGTTTLFAPTTNANTIPVPPPTRSRRRGAPKDRVLQKRIPIWNVKEGRKISGFASPMLKNLADYLNKHPDCIVYESKNKQGDPNASDEVNSDAFAKMETPELSAWRQVLQNSMQRANARIPKEDDTQADAATSSSDSEQKPSINNNPFASASAIPTSSASSSTSSLHSSSSSSASASSVDAKRGLKGRRGGDMRVETAKSIPNADSSSHLAFHFGSTNTVSGLTSATSQSVAHFEGDMNMDFATDNEIGRRLSASHHRVLSNSHSRSHLHTHNPSEEPFTVSMNEFDISNTASFEDFASMLPPPELQPPLSAVSGVNSNSQTNSGRGVNAPSLFDPATILASPPVMLTDAQEYPNFNSGITRQGSGHRDISDLNIYPASLLHSASSASGSNSSKNRRQVHFQTSPGSPIHFEGQPSPPPMEGSPYLTAGRTLFQTHSNPHAHAHTLHHQQAEDTTGGNSNTFASHAPSAFQPPTQSVTGRTTPRGFGAANDLHLPPHHIQSSRVTTATAIDRSVKTATPILAKVTSGNLTPTRATATAATPVAQAAVVAVANVVATSSSISATAFQAKAVQTAAYAQATARARTSPVSSAVSAIVPAGAIAANVTVASASPIRAQAQPLTVTAVRAQAAPSPMWPTPAMAVVATAINSHTPQPMQGSQTSPSAINHVTNANTGLNSVGVGAGMSMSAFGGMTSSASLNSMNLNLSVSNTNPSASSGGMLTSHHRHASSLSAFTHDDAHSSFMLSAGNVAMDTPSSPSLNSMHAPHSPQLTSYPRLSGSLLGAPTGNTFSNNPPPANQFDFFPSHENDFQFELPPMDDVMDMRP